VYNINDVKIRLITESAERLVNISDEDYFKGDAFKGFVSNSSMSLINPAQGGSPSKFITGFEKKKSAGALELGTAVHRMLLEKGQFFIDDVVKPTGKVASIMERYFHLLQEGSIPSEEAIVMACEENDYYSGKLTQVRIENVLRDGKTYLDHLYDRENCNDCITLTQEHKDKLDKCLESVKANESLLHLLEGQLSNNFERYNEDVFIMNAEAVLPPKDIDEFEDKTTKVWIKAKIDNWSIDFENKVVTLNDLKTTGASIADFIGSEFEGMNLDGQVYKAKIEGSFSKFHYYRQMKLYMDILKSYVATKYDATEENGWSFKCNMLVVETNAPHYSHVFQVGDRWMTLGEYEYISLLKRIAYHNEYGYDSFVNINLNDTTIIW
jgi:hypothetical protein